MPSAHLSCPDCRIRLRPDSAAIDLFAGRCPLCGAGLVEVASASDVIGFRSLDVGALFEREPDEQIDSTVDPVQFLTRREAASARDAQGFGRWSDDGGSAAVEAVVGRPALR